MGTNRRYWLKQSGLALAGLALLPNDTAARWQYSRWGHSPLLPEGTIRLSSNENPYGPSPLAKQAMADAIAGSNRYGWGSTNQLIDKIAATYQLEGSNVLLGAGSSEILGIVAHYAALDKGNAVSADPVFRTWWAMAEKGGLNISKVPLTADKKHDLPAMYAQINAQTRLVYICNPNNPTGTIVPAAELRSFVEEVSKKTLVMLDEAYMEYCDESSLAGMVTTNKNLVVVKTFSKIYGLAGARIGYALAHAGTIAQLEQLQPWPNAGVSAVSVAAAMASLGDKEFITLSKNSNRAVRAFTCDTFRELKIPFIASGTNFIYYSSQGFSGDINAELKKQGIEATRIIEEQGRWTRITVGTREEMNQYTAALKNIWK